MEVYGGIATAILVFTPLLRITVFYSRVYETLLLAKPIWLQKMTMESRVLAYVTGGRPDVWKPKSQI